MELNWIEKERNWQCETFWCNLIFCPSLVVRSPSTSPLGSVHCHVASHIFVSRLSPMQSQCPRDLILSSVWWSFVQSFWHCFSLWERFWMICGGTGWGLKVSSPHPLSDHQKLRRKTNLMILLGSDCELKMNDSYFRPDRQNGQPASVMIPMHEGNAQFPGTRGFVIKNDSLSPIHPQPTAKRKWILKFFLKKTGIQDWRPSFRPH